MASNALPANEMSIKSPPLPSKSPTSEYSTTKRVIAAHGTRSMSLTNSSPLNSSGAQFRRPVPPPPAFSASVAINDQCRSNRPSVTPKLATVSTSAFANTVDLGSIIPKNVDDPFDAEWTNVITNLTQSVATPDSSDTTHLKSTESNTPTQVENRQIIDTASSVSTNPFAISVSPVTSGHNSPGLKKEFDVRM